MDNPTLLELKELSRKLNEQISRKKLSLFAAKQHCSKRFTDDSIDVLDGELETLINKSGHLNARIRSCISAQLKFSAKKTS